MFPLAINFNNLEWGGKGFAYALEQSHLPGLIITATLFVLSVVSWSVMFSKLALISRSAQNNFRFMTGFRKASTVMEPYEKSFSVPGSPLHGVYRAASREMAVHLTGTPDPEDARRGRIPDGAMVTPDQMGAVRNAMDRAIGEAVVSLENRMAFLATAVSGAPFLGLLGTVWGVMETFSGVAESGSSASLKSMAPGVAAALVTTVVGLLVAIPAMFGYNFIVSRIRIHILEMHNFAAELASYFEREYVHYGPATVIVEGRVPATAPAPAYRDPGPFVPAPPAMAAGFSNPAPALDAFLPARSPASVPRGDDGPPINPIAEQAAARRRVLPDPGPELR